MKIYRILLFTLLVFIFTGFFGCGSDDSETSFTATVNIASVDGNAGEGDTGDIEFNIQLNPSNESGGTITISYTVSGTAESGQDFTPLPGSVQIPEGDSQAGIDLEIIDDMDDEEDEEIIITLDSDGLPQGVTVGDQNTAAVTIADNDNPPGGGGLPEVFTMFDESIQIEMDGDFVVIESEGIPNHPSPYWDMSDPLFEENTNAGFMLNPNNIAVQDWVFRIPLNPAEAANHEGTPGGPMGISINGVPFFNQFAAGNSGLDDEIASFDQYNGHPQMDDAYHYHLEPLYLTDIEGSDAFLGFLLDGFPVYGPMEDGDTVTNADLDDFHGHSHATADYPEGIYHYHITDADPYINGDGFFGTSGTVTQ